MPGIVWLASYPKSGNTWMRIFLSNLCSSTGSPIDINELDSTPVASRRELFDDVVGIESSDLTAQEISKLRPEAFACLASSAEEPVMLKIHDANTVGEDIPLVSAAMTKAVVYIVRNPLDVAVSLADHLNIEIDETIRNMSSSSFALARSKNRLHVQLQQVVQGWSDHVASWVDNRNLRVHIVRYEDMLEDPAGTFSAVVSFLELPATPIEITLAIKNSSFDEMQRQEASHGFKERSAHSQRFFRSGRAGAWREVLTTAQADRIVNDHRRTMRRFAYLDKAGEVIF